MSAPSDKSLYDRDGFLHLPGLFSPGGITEIEENLTTYIDKVGPTVPKQDIVFELTPSGAQAKIRNLWRMEKHSDYFSDLPRLPRLWNRISDLLNGEPVVAAVELFAKPARIGSAVPYHQDNAYFNLVPPDALTCWIALDASTLENGCVHYLRGSHLPGLRPHVASDVPGNSQMLADSDAASEFEDVPGILPRGDAILHHCCLWHRSEPNRSEYPRRGLLIVYRGEHCRVDPEAAKTYSEALSTLIGN
jgi:phytanoyl-CoA hydroxylase